MKKLNTKKLIIFIVILVCIIIFSFFLFKNIRENTREKDVYTYKGPGGEYTFKIVKEENQTLHVIKIYSGSNYHLISLRYGPKELEKIPMDNVADLVLYNGDFMKKNLYITQDPQLPEKTNSLSAIAVIEINRVTGQADFGVFKINTMTAVTRETNQTIKNELPLKTCDDVNDDTSIILIKLGDSTRIYNDNGCVILEGKNGDDIIKVSDKLVLQLLGVF